MLGINPWDMLPIMANKHESRLSPDGKQSILSRRRESRQVPFRLLRCDYGAIHDKAQRRRPREQMCDIPFALPSVVDFLLWRPRISSLCEAAPEGFFCSRTRVATLWQNKSRPAAAWYARPSPNALSDGGAR